MHWGTIGPVEPVNRGVREKGRSPSMSLFRDETWNGMLSRGMSGSEGQNVMS